LGTVLLGYLLDNYIQIIYILGDGKCISTKGGCCMDERILEFAIFCIESREYSAELRIERKC